MIDLRHAAAVLLAVAPLAAAVTTGCSSNDRMTGVAAAKLPANAQGLEHESCDESGNRVEVLDLNGDGKADIRRVFSKGTGREICRVTDLNHDGKPDLYEYFDGNGAVRRREFCYDDTGVVNAIESYDAGRLTKREYDTSGQHKIDTWDYFDPGVPLDPKSGRPLHPSRRERDRAGHGRVDEWWTWDGTKVSISRDTNGDGKPDPGSTLVLGGGDTDAGAAPPPSSAGDGGAPVASSPVASSASPVPAGAAGSSGSAAAVDAKTGSASAPADAGLTEGGRR
jgi:hypothetical protein